MTYKDRARQLAGQRAPAALQFIYQNMSGLGQIRELPLPVPTLSRHGCLETSAEAADCRLKPTEQNQISDNPRT
jgi:hypothetical protein